MKAEFLIFQEIVPAYRVGIFRMMYQRFGSLLCHSMPTKKSKVASASDMIDYPNEILNTFRSNSRNQKV